MDNTQELRTLIDSFISYRDILVPLQESLRSIVDSYDAMKSDLTRLDKSFGGETKSQLGKIYETLSSQAQKSTDLSSRIEQFVKSSDGYTQAVNAMTERFKTIADRLDAVNKIEHEAETQIARINEIIDEKKINYNIKDLQKTLESYNKNVERVSEFINKDVASVLMETGKKIDSIKQDNETVSAMLAEQGKTVDTLAATYKETNAFLRTLVQKEDVNEEYLFDVLDKWAASRKVKIKR